MRKSVLRAACWSGGLGKKSKKSMGKSGVRGALESGERKGAEWGAKSESICVETAAISGAAGEAREEETPNPDPHQLTSAPLTHLFALLPPPPPPPSPTTTITHHHHHPPPPSPTTTITHHHHHPPPPSPTTTITYQQHYGRPC